MIFFQISSQYLRGFQSTCNSNDNYMHVTGYPVQHGVSPYFLWGKNLHCDLISIPQLHNKLSFKFWSTQPPPPHSSLVDYLAQVIKAKNCPTTFYCIFQLVWVSLTNMQNIRGCLWTSNKTLFS